ncbi:MAG: 7,8-didemethyl-8-hydroxy-5-deazariboflavin synthase subunit CofH [Oceanospirillaceae bacterium]|nr:7,8-didemethyl-8-hydroxy-5-deazariboflavin synthase subunit CofH [Oceanospirillaceae bacterium]MBT13005.1 7,8-didemethyl-8-hydroxy-5-deazariboflavin synthase subunit CofH [Oceanospirillaceae bacterium]
MNGHYSEQTDLKAVLAKASPDVRTILEKALAGEELTQPEAIVLFETEGADYSAVLKTADAVRQQRCGDEASFIVTRNINFTNVCYMGCSFCNFSVAKDDASAEFISFDEIADRAQEAWERGATEVCVQGGLHPDIDKDFYRNVLIAIKTRVPDMHIHAFSPFEIWYGSRKARMSPEDFLRDLKAHGLGSMPGTAAEILAPEVRKILTKDKLKTDEWVRIIKAAHSVGVPTTATIMYGHVDGPADWAYHLDLLRSIQKDTGGFTEFVPLGFIHYETPLYKENPDGVRTGPTRAEHFKMHAIARLMLQGHIDNIQASWVKMGPETAAQMLRAGANDLGGTLMNESISTAAGGQHGQEVMPQDMVNNIHRAGLHALQRSTLYKTVKDFGPAATAQPELADPALLIAAGG